MIKRLEYSQTPSSRKESIMSNSVNQSLTDQHATPSNLIGNPQQTTTNTLSSQSSANPLSTNVSRTETAVEDHETKPHKSVTLKDEPDQLYPPSRRATRESAGGLGGAEFKAPSLSRKFTDLFISERKIKREPTFKVSCSLE